jgi:hypothetical protein
VPSNDRPCTPVTPSAVHGKEGVVGSSPTPGSSYFAGRFRLVTRVDRVGRVREGCQLITRWPSRSLGGPALRSARYLLTQAVEEATAGPRVVRDWARPTNSIIINPMGFDLTQPETVEHAKRLLAEGRYEEHLDFLEEAIEQFPQDSEIRLLG